MGGFNAPAVNTNLNSAMASDGQGSGDFSTVQTAVRARAPYRDGPAFHVHIRQMAHTSLVFPTPQVIAYFTNNGSEEEGASINDAVKSLCANGHHDQAVRY